MSTETPSRSPQPVVPTDAGRPAEPGATVGRRLGRFVGYLVQSLVELVAGLVGRVLSFSERWLVDAKRATYGLAVTRILLGLTAIGLLLANFSTRLYAFGSGSAWNGEAAEPISDFPKIWLFSLFSRIALDDVAFTAAYLVLLVLAVAFTLGWRTRIVLPVFFVAWVSFIEMNDSLGDQGDNMYRMVLLALLFADPAMRWSLDARRRARPVDPGRGWLARKWAGEPLLPSWVTNTSHNLVLVTLTCHVCFVYASGALFKAGGTPWQQGYAIYNPLQTQRFGTWPALSDLVTAWTPAVTAVSWASIILQLCFPLMLLQRFTRVIGLFGILGFHIGIAVLMGLPWFSLAMVAIDSIFIRDVTWRWAAGYVREAWVSAGSGGSSGPSVPEAVSVPPPPEAAAAAASEEGTAPAGGGPSGRSVPVAAPTRV
ncbi:HTTM domain-containing protein [Auraticoccus monumenti]|uniref:Vitamin K-dependent gamma-carboxylase n=1 Tax=Auraticoccus monumenti TaxID=675864 RepID=A0A1G6U564_9ACTN|nr:HTTM domain-containing protein [Auraticoccus monumenti]SDD35727.1 Vitamin K-dependent gamma-carboxylase [Auraticoccus monumenti]